MTHPADGLVTIVLLPLVGATQDLTLAMAMVRPSRWFLHDATMNEDVLTAERYGAVRRVCVVAEDDVSSLSAGFQRRMASLNPGTEVRAEGVAGS